MKRLYAIAALAALAIQAASALGVREAPPAELAPLSIRVGAIKGPTGIGMIGLFEAPPTLPDGLTPSFEALAGADAAAAKLLSGELDAAVLPVNMAAKLYNAGLPYRMVALVGNGMVRVLTNDPGLDSVAGLRGTELHVAGQGATPDFVLRTILKHADLEPESSVRLNYSLPYPELAASLASGKIKTAVLPEPFITVAMRADPSLREAFSLDAAWKGATGQDSYPMSVFVVRDALVRERPAGVRALAEAYRGAIRQALADPVAAGALVEKFDFGLKAPIAAAAIPNSAYVFTPAPAARAAVEALLSVFLEAAPGSIGGKLPDAAFYAELGL